MRNQQEISGIWWNLRGIKSGDRQLVMLTFEEGQTAGGPRAQRSRRRTTTLLHCPDLLQRLCGRLELGELDGQAPSLAAVGVMENGDRWLAPANWVLPSSSREVWERVRRARQIRAYSFFDDASYPND